MILGQSVTVGGNGTDEVGMVQLVDAAAGRTAAAADTAADETAAAAAGSTAVSVAAADAAETAVVADDKLA